MSCRAVNQSFVYIVLYSENCIFDELRQFFESGKPVRRIPTRFGNEKKKEDAMCAAIGHIYCHMPAINMMNMTGPVSAVKQSN